MYSKIALVLVAAVGSAALAASARQDPADGDVRPRVFRTPGIATTQPAASPAQQESSSVTVRSTPRNQPGPSMGGMGGGMGGMGGGMGGMGGMSSAFSPNNLGRGWRGNGNAVYFPEDASIARETDQLIRQLGEARSDSDRDKLKAKLGEVLEKQFELRQKRHESEIAELEAQVKKLKDLVGKRQENRREIIARRLEQIVRESQGLGW
jgi:hypothetical protein